MDETKHFILASLVFKAVLHVSPELLYLHCQVEAQWQHLREPAWNCRPLLRSRPDLRNHSPAEQELIGIPSQYKYLPSLKPLQESLVNGPYHIFLHLDLHMRLIRNCPNVRHVKQSCNFPPLSKISCLLVMPYFRIDVPVFQACKLSCQVADDLHEVMMRQVLVAVALLYHGKQFINFPSPLDCKSVNLLRQHIQAVCWNMYSVNFLF